MSTRALRKLQSENDQEEAHEESFEEEPIEKSIKNRFQLLEENEQDFEQNSKSSSNLSTENQNLPEIPQNFGKKNQNLTSKSKKKAEKKSLKMKKPAQKSDGPNPDAKFLENLDFEFHDNGMDTATVRFDQNNEFYLAESALFQIEYRNLNPENELKRMFGKNILDGERRPIKKVARNSGLSQQRLGGKLVKPKNNMSWQIAKTGLSMVLEKPLKNGSNLFKFEHSPAYQNAQFLFWDAAKRMNPDLFVAILRDHPFHIDTLLQMSDIYKANEDFATARDLVERAIYACETAFHPLFNVALNNARLDYSQQENRPFFLALFKHMIYACQRACYRTALEFCKLIYSLDPDEDPLGMLLIIDFLCLRCKQYDYLINLYHVMEAKRNLSQLPNFCFSVAMATYLKSRDPETKKEADEKLKDALRKFPTLLLIILDKCSVEPDSEVSKCEAFSLKEQFYDGNGLKCLYHVFITRCFSLWKEHDVIYWLESNVKSLIKENFTSKNDLYANYQKNRKTRYHLTPLNVCRHVILCELKEALAYLPDDVKEKSINNFDPLPPSDSRSAYKMPLATNSDQSASSSEAGSSLMGSFLRSLMPNYNPAENDAMVAGAVADFPRSVQAVLRAMRELLNDIHPTAAGADPDNQEGAENLAPGDELDENDGWTDEDDEENDQQQN